MDKNIPLSELIRIGSKIRGKCECTLMDEEGRTCAIGAAYMAKFGEIEDPDMGTEAAAKKLGIHKTFVDPAQMPKEVKQAIKVREKVEEVIWRLNDKHYWSREKIADWLESIGK